MSQKMIDFFSEINRQAKHFPASIALIGPGIHLSYEGLSQSINNIATRVLSLGIEPGSLVAVHSRNPNIDLLTNLALMKAGMTVAFSNSPSAYISHDIVFDVLISDVVPPPDQRFGFRKRLPFTKDWTQPHQFSRRPIKSKPFGALFASSGSTGTNKLYHANKKNIDFRINLKASEKFFEGVPRYLPLMLSSSMVSVIDIMITLAKGGQVIYLPSMSSAQALDAVAIYQPNYVAASPFTITEMVEIIRKYPRKMRKIDQLYTGGSYCAPEILAAANELITDNIVPAYGLTELGLVAMSPLREIEGIEGAVGKLVSGMEVEIVDDAGKRLPEGQVGEIRIRPPSAAPLGLFQNNRRIEIMDGDWFSPGDFGHIESSGLLVTTGRKKNVINIGGNKHDPERIEDLLRQLDLVSDIAVAGVTGSSGFDEIYALVCSEERPEVETINKKILELNYKFKIRTLFSVEEIPRTAGGKVKREEVMVQIRDQISRM
ncbi:class I adenylate-forming enzyme family protein [Oricola indica]|jgi:acyl-CoA synthetase (AMP-forming)/AMP-acid ligase II|uniref:class I adenylate-forming enzyme family protein n=1 Tax=Oricola indica TaxID=2872591 RepID=UPI001CBA6E17|nr:fatty acid--CoA ligase family protein [Oricola indica]